MSGGGTQGTSLLEVYSRPVSNAPAQYIASQTIIFYPDFESYSGDEFAAEIKTNPTNGGDTDIDVILTAQPLVNVN